MDDIAEKLISFIFVVVFFWVAVVFLVGPFVGLGFLIWWLLQ